MQVSRKIIGAKIEIVNCLLVVCANKWRFKIVFRKLNCSTTTKAMGRQMYFYYLEWLFVYNQNKAGYLQITTLQVYYF